MRRDRANTLPLICLLVLFAPLAGCQNEAERLADRVSGLTRGSGLNGYLYVERRGKVVFDGALRDTRLGLPPTERTSQVRLASLTKVFTQLATLRLIEQGRLDLSAKVDRYLPELDAEWVSRVEIGHLLNMSSGLPREFGEPWAGVDPESPVFFDALAQTALGFEPGDREEYSNVGYWLLGRILERVSGESFDQVMVGAIFDPLGMSGSGRGDTATLLPGYRPNGPLVNESFASRYTSGGYWSSVDDLVRLLHALRAEEVIPRELVGELVDPKTGTLTVYGALPGHANVLRWDRGEDLLVVLLNPSEPEELAVVQALLSDIDDALGIDRAPSVGGSRKITLKPIRELSVDHPLEAAMAKWSAAIEAGDLPRAWSILEAKAAAGAFEADDPTWEGLLEVRGRIEGFRAAGFRWVETELPPGLEVWFVGEGEAKIGLLWIPDEDDPSRIAGLMVKPVDTEWLGKSF